MADAIPETMRAVVGETLGGPDRYDLVDVAVPKPAADEVLVAVEASGLGYVDALVAQGRYQVKPQTPYCPGMEFVGRIVAVGERVQAFQMGDRVAGSGFGGGLAEFACLSEGAAHRVPDEMDAGAAAGFIVNYTTAWHALVDRAELTAGETVLVLGAAGGTGMAAIQVARLCGARVIAGASTAEKRLYALEHGAHETLDYSVPNWRDELKALTDGHGVDVVFDPVAGDLLEPAFRSLAWRGRHLVIGFTGGPIPALPVNLALLKGASLVGVDLRQFGSVFEPQAAARVRARLFESVTRGDLKPPVGQSFELEDYAAALALAISRDGLGKTIVHVDAR